jgi:hypothetical protein
MVFFVNSFNKFVKSPFPVYFSPILLPVPLFNHQFIGQILSPSFGTPSLMVVLEMEKLVELRLNSASSDQNMKYSS